MRAEGDGVGVVAGPSVLSPSPSPVVCYPHLAQASGTLEIPSAQEFHGKGTPMAKGPHDIGILMA